MNECLSPHSCKNKSKSWGKRSSYNISKYEEAYEIIKDKKKVYSTGHFLYRLRDRMISIDEVVEVIDNGWVIDGNADNSFVVLGYYKLLGNYQPLHIVFGQNLRKDVNGVYKNQWIIKTVYTPIKEIWGDNFDEKICFCGKRRFGEEI